MPPPAATTVIIPDSGHGARIVWLKPMSEGLPRGLPATLIAANPVPSRLNGPAEPPIAAATADGQARSEATPSSGPARSRRELD
jgi:hypothetical protein